MIFNGLPRSKKSFMLFLNSVDDLHYNYDKTIFHNMKSKITVQCKKHGSFETTPSKHLNGHGCPICSNIKQYGHPVLSKLNLKNYPDILKKYLSEKFEKFDFSEFKIDDKFHFMCKQHGHIINDKISCKQCNSDNTESKKLDTINKLLEKRSEQVMSLEYDKILLKCDHMTILYNNKQLYNNVQLCGECKPNDFNKITEQEFIIRAINRMGPEYSSLYSLDSTRYINAVTKIPLICKKHGTFNIMPSNMFKGQGCPKCSNIVSNPEQEINKFIREQINTIESDRLLIKPLEIDILVPSKKFGIEYNGLMWHSVGKSKSVKFNNFKDESLIKKKHLLKTNLSEQSEHQLFHIFENEWLDVKKQNIWKSVINNKIGSNTKIFARKCSYKDVSDGDAKIFLESNHLQGYCRSSIRIGLYYDDELVSLMTFGKSRFNKNVEYELIRFCTKINLIIVGGASKLLSKFVIQYNPKSLISYANRRWSTGNLYEKLGFEFKHNSPPNYFYFKPNENILESRNKYQKHKLSKLLSKFDIKLTESENMYNNGFRKIYDSGNKIFIKNFI